MISVFGNGLMLLDDEVLGAACEQWRWWRRRGLRASDVFAIFGEPYNRTPTPDDAVRLIAAHYIRLPSRRAMLPLAA